MANDRSRPHSIPRHPQTRHSAPQGWRTAAPRWYTEGFCPPVCPRGSRAFRRIPEGTPPSDNHFPESRPSHFPPAAVWYSRRTAGRARSLPAFHSPHRFRPLHPGKISSGSAISAHPSDPERTLPHLTALFLSSVLQISAEASYPSPLSSCTHTCINAACRCFLHFRTEGFGKHFRKLRKHFKKLRFPRCFLAPFFYNTGRSTYKR